MGVMVEIASPVFIGSVALIIAVVQVVKMIFPTLDSRWFPAVAIGASASIAVLQVVADVETTNVIVGALVAALTASGAYSQKRAAFPPAGDAQDNVGVSHWHN